MRLCPSPSASASSALIAFLALAPGCMELGSVPVGDSEVDPVDAPDIPELIPGVSCDGVTGEGFAVGQVADSWSLTDGDGNPMELGSLCGNVIYYEGCAEW